MTHDPEMVLGIPVVKESHDHIFWEKLINKVKTKLNIWSMRDLKFEGKIYAYKIYEVVNNLVCS